MNTLVVLSVREGAKSQKSGSLFFYFFDFFSSNINMLICCRQISGAVIRISSNEETREGPDGIERPINIQGTPDAITVAKYLINMRLVMHTSSVHSFVFSFYSILAIFSIKCCHCRQHLASYLTALVLTKFRVSCLTVLNCFWCSNHAIVCVTLHLASRWKIISWFYWFVVFSYFQSFDRIFV